jgi:DNA polymerase
MSLDLDKRQRAMLREMGIRLWQPQPVATEVPGVVAPTDTQKIAVSAPSPVVSAAPSNAVNTTAGSSAWTLCEARVLYAKPAADNGQAPTPGAAARWLLLIETPSGSTEADPLSGDAGKLLDNMLRASELHQSARVVCVPLSRRLDAGHSAPLDSALVELFKAEKPDVILIMGRLAAQALLQSTEPLGKLRGRTHQLAGVAAVVTYDAAYLLRSLPDKAKAWDDLCRAQYVAKRGTSC